MEKNQKQKVSQKEKFIKVISKTRTDFIIFLVSLIILLIGAYIIEIDSTLKTNFSLIMLFFGLIIGFMILRDQNSGRFLLPLIALFITIMPTISLGVKRNSQIVTTNILNYIFQILLTNREILEYLFNLSYFMIFLLVPIIIIIASKEIVYSFIDER